jgi:hypothetical protein
VAVVCRESRTDEGQDTAEQAVVDPEAKRVGVGEWVKFNESHSESVSEARWALPAGRLTISSGGSCVMKPGLDLAWGPGAACLNWETFTRRT